MKDVVGAVFHIMGASMAAADGWFHNPASKVSAHFGIGTDGRLVQWVDTADRAWHAGAANLHWIGVETEGASGPLSDAGIVTFSKLYRWLHDQYGIPFQTTDDVNGRGLGWHGMGGAAWGGHPYCPGPQRRAQRSEVIRLAQGPAPLPALPIAVLEEPMFSVPPDNKPHDYPIGSWVKVIKPLSTGTRARAVILNRKGDALKTHEMDFWGNNLSYAMAVPAGGETFGVTNEGPNDLAVIYDIA